MPCDIVITAQFARRLAATLLAAWVGLAAPAALASDGAAVALMYHRFGEDAHPSTNVRLDQFEAHLERLRVGEHAAVTLGRVVDSWTGGAPLPERAVAISVDDAYASVFAEAWPRLRAAGITFTLFVATEPVDRGQAGYMSWDQIRTLVAAGVEIGSQAVTHPHMPDLSEEDIRTELVRSADRIEAETGTRPTLFAYPYGEASATVMRLAEEAGYRAGFGQHSGALSPGLPRFYLPRFPINEDFGAPDLVADRMAALPLPVGDITPESPALAPGDPNPPHFGFTVTDPALALDRLACFRSDMGPVGTMERLGPRVELRFAQPFAAGRTRINCTLPAADGGWRWFGWQIYRPG